MLSMIFGAAIVAIGVPAFLTICVCLTGNRLIRATEASDGDCARGLAREASKPAARAWPTRARKPLWVPANERGIDALAN